VPGWDPANDRNGNGKVDDQEFANLANPEAHAREMKQARISIYYWGPPTDDHVMNIGHPDFQRFLAERYMPSLLALGFDGFFVDSTRTYMPGPGGDADVLEYPRRPGEGNAWLRDMQMVLAKVKIALPDALLMANGWTTADPFVIDGNHRESVWLNVTTSGHAFQARLDSAAGLEKRGKIQMLQYNPIFEPERCEFGKKVPISFERDAIFGLAAYYLISGDYTYYGQGAHPYQHALSWYNPAADFDIGKPQGPYEKIVLEHSEPSEGANLLTNGGFELDDDGDSKPDGWVIAEPVELVEDVVKVGKRAVKVVSDDVHINNINKYFVTLKPNTTYTLSAWVKTEDLTGQWGAQIYVGDFAGAKPGGTGVGFNGTNDWTQVIESFTTAHDAWGRVTFRVVESTGTAWFDHIQIVEGFYADTILYTRRFSNALVLVRPAQPALGWGDETAIDYALDGTYLPLEADGTLGDPIEKVGLRVGEAAILIPARK